MLGGLLLRHAVQSAEAEHQVCGCDADNVAAGKKFGEFVESEAVIRIVECGDEHDAVRDVEIGVTGRQPLAVEVHGVGHG